MDYELCLELASGLEVVKKYGLRDNPVVKNLAKAIYDHQIKDVSLLNGIAEALWATSLKTDEKPNVDLTPRAILDAARLEKDICLYVEDVRDDLFGKPEVPFASADDAMEWLRKHGREELKDILPERDEVVLGSERHFSSFGDIWFDEDSDTMIADLLAKVEKIRVMTGATYGSVMMHLLTNSPLCLMKYMWRGTSYGGELFRKPLIAVELIVLGPLTFSEMQSLYRQQRSVFGRTKKKEINVRHLELYRLVDGKGTPLVKGVVAFWREVMEQWNQNHPEDRYTTWKGVKTAYDRLLMRLERGSIQAGDHVAIKPRLQEEKEAKRG
jgi:hypothetical protein